MATLSASARLTALEDKQHDLLLNGVAEYNMSQSQVRYALEELRKQISVLKAETASEQTGGGKNLARL